MARSCTSPIRMHRFLAAAGSSLKMHDRQATRLLIALMNGIICPFAALVKAEFLWYYDLVYP